MTSQSMTKGERIATKAWKEAFTHGVLASFYSYATVDENARPTGTWTCGVQFYKCVSIGTPTQEARMLNNKHALALLITDAEHQRLRTAKGKAGYPLTEVISIDCQQVGKDQDDAERKLLKELTLGKSYCNARIAQEQVKEMIITLRKRVAADLAELD